MKWAIWIKLSSFALQSAQVHRYTLMVHSSHWKTYPTHPLDYVVVLESSSFSNREFIIITAHSLLSLAWGLCCHLSVRDAIHTVYYIHKISHWTWACRLNSCDCMILWAQHKLICFLFVKLFVTITYHIVVANEAHFCLAPGVWLPGGAALGSRVPGSSNSCWALPLTSQEPIRRQEKEWGGATAGRGDN